MKTLHYYVSVRHEDYSGPLPLSFKVRDLEPVATHRLAYALASATFHAYRMNAIPLPKGFDASNDSRIAIVVIRVARDEAKGCNVALKREALYFVPSIHGNTSSSSK